MRHEFPSEWAKFKNATVVAGSAAPLSFNLFSQHFPFWATQLGLKLGSTSGQSNGVSAVQFFAETTNAVNFYDGANTATAKKDSLALDQPLNLMAGSLANVPMPPVIAPANPPAMP